MERTPRKSPIARKVYIDRDRAVEFLKSVGFVEGGLPGEFRRPEDPSPAREAAGVVGFTWVDLNGLLRNPTLWYGFVRRWTKRMRRNATP